ncbi:MAG: class I SAM-dependent rRNA methyltransferase [Deltaproteobacteria bacterium]|nr:MAG: class I SAM-dependent rRNA methyltransferase [Deltaproteobacteria bacterium]
MSKKSRSRRSGALRVNGYSAEWLRKGFPWIYPKEISRPVAGRGPLKVEAPDGTLLGTALPDQGWIAARVYRHDGGPLDRDWLWGVLDLARELREGILLGDTDGYRLVHGENDGLPGLRIDRWGHAVVIVLDSPAVAPLLDEVVAWLEDRFTPRSIYLCYRPDPRDDRDFSAAEPAPGLLAGHSLRAEIAVRERGMLMNVRPWDGPDVGMYPDMREVRAFMAPYWGGQRVLNTFAYTGAFSVAAALGGALEVVSVDLSTPYLDRLESNLRANDLDLDLHEILAEDTFKALDRFRRTGRRFDRVILDPPSFSHSSEGTWSAKRDYPRLAAAAMRVLDPGGWLIAASNQGQLSPRDFRGFIVDAARRAGCRAQELAWLGQAPDYPAATWFPEGRYLKVGIWRIIPS